MKGFNFFVWHILTNMYAVANDMCFCFCLGDQLILSVFVFLRQDPTEPTILVHFLFICMFSIAMIRL